MHLLLHAQQAQTTRSAWAVAQHDERFDIIERKLLRQMPAPDRLIAESGAAAVRAPWRRRSSSLSTGGCACAKSKHKGAQIAQYATARANPAHVRIVLPLPHRLEDRRPANSRTSPGTARDFGGSVRTNAPSGPMSQLSTAPTKKAPGLPGAFRSIDVARALRYQPSVRRLTVSTRKVVASELSVVATKRMRTFLPLYAATL